MTIGKVRQSAVNAITKMMIHRSFKPLSCWEAIEEAPSQSTLLSNLGSRTNSTFDISLISYLLFFSDKRYKSERYWRQKTFVANIWNGYHTHGWLNRQNLHIQVVSYPSNSFSDLYLKHLANFAVHNVHDIHRQYQTRWYRKCKDKYK